MKIEDIDWVRVYREHPAFTHGEVKPGSDESRARWDARAHDFVQKRGRSSYIQQLIGILDLEDGETVFDMGCGGGALAVPLAEDGHDVIAVDFSEGMLEGLAASAREKGVEGRIERFRRSWQQDWGDLPQADVAVSSRSFVIEDLDVGIAKLEGQARRKAVISIGAGDRPYRDARIYAAMGRQAEGSEPPRELATMANYLWTHGRFPRIDYIEYPGIWHRETREELEEVIRKTHAPEDEAQEAALAAYLDEHIVYDEEQGWWTLDYPRKDRWAVLSWPVGE